MKLAQLIAGIALSVAMVFSNSGVSQAQTPPSAAPSCSKKVAEFAKVTNDAELKEISARVQSDIHHGVVGLATPLAELSLQDMKAAHILKDGTSSLVVTLPITTKGVAPVLSIVTIIYNGDRIQTFGESRFTQNEAGNFQLNQRVNGIPSQDVDTGVAWRTSDEIAEAISQQQPAVGVQPQGWGEKAGCLAATLGVAYWMAKVIAATCGAACITSPTNPVSAGTCGICVGAFVTLTTATFGAIYLCFTL